MASRIVFDASTGEQMVVDLTPEELLSMQLASGQEEEATPSDAAVASARAKLAALGLTDEEISAIVGG